MFKVDVAEFTVDNVVTENPTDPEHMRIYVVADEERITSNIMSREEMAEAIGIRAAQIENGSNIYCSPGNLAHTTKKSADIGTCARAISGGIIH